MQHRCYTAAQRPTVANIRGLGSARGAGKSALNGLGTGGGACSMAFARYKMHGWRSARRSDKSALNGLGTGGGGLHHGVC